MKVKLIVPKDAPKGPGIGWWNQEYFSLFRGECSYSSPRLSLPTLAAFTPENVNIELIDENITTIDYDDKVDLVGITFYTFDSLRAYAIADEFRKREVKVVLGGIHASVLPGEAIMHADSVVIGEAEDVWGKVIEDSRKNHLQRFYRAGTQPSLDSRSAPRWDLIQHKSYSTPMVQTTRGCPYDCEFCSIKGFLGKKFRCKPVAKIMEEVRKLAALGFGNLFFCDDNFIGNRDHAIALLRELIPLKIMYQTQMSIGIANDKDMLELLSESGCKRVLIGLESISNSNLRTLGKHASYRAEEYIAAIRKIQSFGIEVGGSFILGCDFDDSSVFENTAQFIKDSDMALAIFNILTPYPGTRLFKRLEAEGRILHKDWSLYDSMHVCFQPKRMSPEELQKGYYWIYQKVFSYEEIFRRLKNVWNLWNATSVRKWDRMSGMLLNLSYNYAAYSYPAELQRDKI